MGTSWYLYLVDRPDSALHQNLIRAYWQNCCSCARGRDLSNWFHHLYWNFPFFAFNSVWHWLQERASYSTRLTLRLIFYWKGDFANRDRRLLAEASSMVPSPHWATDTHKNQASSLGEGQWYYSLHSPSSCKQRVDPGVRANHCSAWRLLSCQEPPHMVASV